MSTALRMLLDREQIPLKTLADGACLDYRTVRRFAAGADRPGARSLQAMNEWLAGRNLSLPADELTSATPRRPRRARKLPTPESTVETRFLRYLTPADLKWWKLSASPFEDVQAPDELWMPPHLEEVDQLIDAAIKFKKILAIVGEPGAGKTSLIRRMYALQRSSTKVKLILPAGLDRKRISHAALSVAILRDLVGRDTGGLSSEARSDLLRQTFADLAGSALKPVLVIDEAHLLGVEGLLALKHIWDSNTMFKPLTLILVGQPGLLPRMQEPAVRELGMRTQVALLPKLDAAMTASYCRWRFGRVGGDADKVFEPGAYKILATRGEYPLAIGSLAVEAMQAARGYGDELVSAALVSRL